MTNNNRRRSSALRCIDCNRVITKANTTDALGTIDICDDCFEIAGLENEHQDGVHDDDQDGPNAACPSCTGIEIADRSKAPTTRTDKGRIDHRPCYAAGSHDKSREGRETCRRAGGPKA